MLVTLNSEIFKAYDVRGVYPDQVNEDAARAIGSAFVAYLGARQIGVFVERRPGRAGYEVRAQSEYPDL